MMSIMSGRFFSLTPHIPAYTTPTEFAIIALFTLFIRERLFVP